MTKPIVRHSDFAHEWQKIYTPYHFTHIIVASNHSHISAFPLHQHTHNKWSVMLRGKANLRPPHQQMTCLYSQTFLECGSPPLSWELFPAQNLLSRILRTFLFIHLRSPWTKAKKSTLTFQRFFISLRAAKLEIHTKSLLRCWNTINFRFFKPSPS